jgi:hypothetical protein
LFKIYNMETENIITQIKWIQLLKYQGQS